MKNMFRWAMSITVLFFSSIVHSQQLYSFANWTAGNTSYTKTVTSPSNTMTVTYTEGINARGNTLCGGCTCYSSSTTAYAIPFYYNQATMYVADYSQNGCFQSTSGLVMAAHWANAVNANQWEQADIVFQYPVCAPVTFNLYDINQDFWSGDDSKYFTDIVEVSALDNNSTSVPLANITIGNSCGNTLSSSGNTRIITGDHNKCSNQLNSVSVGAGGTWVKQITIKYKRGLSDYGPSAPWSQYVIVTNVYGCSSNTILPVELTSFTGACSNGNQEFSWITATETNNDFFTLEKSVNAVDFIEAGRVKGAGNSTSPESYHFVLNSDDAVYQYFRLKQTDFNGKFSYSSVINLECSSDYYGAVTLFPNPVANEARIRFNFPIKEHIVYTITDIYGRPVQMGDIQTDENIRELEFPVDELSGGVYLVEMKVPGKSITFPRLKFIKE